MSQPELAAALRAARPSAPAELRERVRMLAADATVPPRRRLTWRRALVIAVPVAAAIAAAAVLLPRGGEESAATTTTTAVERAAAPKAVDNGTAAAAAPALAPTAAPARAAEAYGALPTPSSVRPQRYSAALELRLRDAAAVSAAGRRATAIVAALGGFPSSLNLEAGGESGYATLVFRVPRGHVQTAVSRLSALGTIVGENVRIQDLGGQVSAVDRRLARLRKTRAEAKAVEPQTPGTAHRVAVLTAQIQKLRRGKAATLRAAGYATVTVRLTTPTAATPVAKDGHGPLHGLAVAFRWLWIGAVYALALGLPFVLLGLGVWVVARSVRRRRVDALLSRS